MTKLIWLMTADAQYVCRAWFVPVVNLYLRMIGKPVVWQHPFPTKSANPNPRRQ